MTVLYETWLYIFLGSAAFVIACIACAAAYGSRRIEDNGKSGAPEGRWQP